MEKACKKATQNLANAEDVVKHASYKLVECNKGRKSETERNIQQVDKYMMRDRIKQPMMKRGKEANNGEDKRRANDRKRVEFTHI